MSYPGVDPADANQTNSVGTQKHSAGEESPRQVTTLTLPDNPEVPEQSPEEKEQLNKAVQEAVSDMFQVIEPWKAREVVRFVVECPSGQKVLAKHLDVLDLAAADLVEDMDLFTRKLFPASLDERGNPVEGGQETFWKALVDPKKRLHFLQMTNKLIMASIVKPKVVDDGVAIRTNPDTAEQEIVFGCEIKDTDEQLKLFGKPVPPLKENEAYVGAINFNDRMTIFTELQKPLGLIEPFREQSSAVLADMESSEGVRGSTQ